MSYLISLFSIALAICAVSADSPPSSHTLWSSDGLGTPLAAGVVAKMPVPSYTVNRWPWGTVPESCYDTATKNKYCNVYDIEVYDVTYSDCPVPWTFCRCNNSTMPAATMFKNAGWTPVRARQYVRTYSSWNDGSTWAYTDFKDINLFGNFPTDPLVFFHENSHNLDFWVAGKGTSPYSYTPDWVSTIKKDTCVPDAYSKASNTEDFAQVGVVGIYNANVGNVNTVKSVACMDDQLNRVNGLLYDSYHYVAGQKCDTRLTPTNKVCMGPAARDSGNCSGVPKKRGLEIRGFQPGDVYEGVDIISATFDGETKDIMDAAAEEIKNAAQSSMKRSLHRSVPVEFKA